MRAFQSCWSETWQLSNSNLDLASLAVPFQYAWGSLSTHRLPSFPPFRSFSNGPHGLMLISGLQQLKPLKNQPLIMGITQYEAKDKISLPSPERPIWKNNVQSGIVSVITKHGWRCWGILFGIRFFHNGRAVLAIEYHIQIRDFTRVSPQQL